MIRTSAIIVAAVLGGCYGTEYSHDYDRGQDFGALKTWAWDPALASEAEQRNAEAPSVLNRERIEKAIELELARKGYRPADATSADFRVRYDTMVRTRAGWDTYHHGHYGYGDSYYEKDQATLVVDVLRSQDNRLIWRGASRKDVAFDATPEQRDESVREAVEGIFSGFPPDKEK